MSLAIIALREMLKSRDRINDLEYELLKTKRDLTKEISSIKTELGIKDVKK
jgi:hypothetical protein